MVPLREQIVERLDRLRDSELREVLSYVEFLTWRAPEEEPLLSVMGILDGSPLSAEEIEQELYGHGNGSDGT